MARGVFRIDAPCCLGLYEGSDFRTVPASRDACGAVNGSEHPEEDRVARRFLERIFKKIYEKSASDFFRHNDFRKSVDNPYRHMRMCHDLIPFIN